MNSTQATQLSLRVERNIAATPERAYRAWTEPGQMVHWFAPSDDMAIEAEVDLKVGGKYRVAMGPHVVQGEYLEVEPGRRLVFTWQWQGETPSNEMLVTVEFLAKDKGTRLLITHDRLASEATRDEHNNGWTAILGRLDEYLGA